MKATELNRLDLFFLPNCDRKGTTINTMYQVVDETEDGIIANGPIQTKHGTMHYEHEFLSSQLH